VHLLPWRNNLTALSQRSNLFIVAFHDVLHISRTGFGDTYPENAAAGEWSMQIDLEPSKPDLPGHMPRTKPHAVNHLIVDDLGNLEIVLVAHDDGDVVGFYTHDLERAMQDFETARRHKQAESTDTSDIDSTPYKDCINNSAKPFFQFNLVQSVWGLAVHPTQRLIAISTNGPHIWVFAFALSPQPIDFDFANLSNTDPAEDMLSGVSYQSSSQSSEDEPSFNFAQQDSLWDLVGPEDRWLTDRSRNTYSELGLRLSLSERRGFGRHGANIPCITFDKEDLIQNARLVSTDISGCTMIWDVKERQYVTKLSAHHERQDSHDPLRAGWGLLSLDPRSFRTTESIISALGVCEIASRSNVHLVDISHSKALIPYNKRWTIFEERRSNSSAPSVRRQSVSPNADSDEENNDEGRADISQHTDNSDVVLNEATIQALAALKSNFNGDARHTDYVNISANDCGEYPLMSLLLLLTLRLCR